MTTYTPAPGTVAFRVIGWLEEQGATKEFNASQMANALDLDPKTITTCLQNALDTGLVFRRQKDRSHPRAPFWYSLTNHGVLQRAWTPNPVDWMQRPADVPVFREGGRTEPLRMADAGSGVGVSAPMTTPSPAVTNLPGHPSAAQQEDSNLGRVETAPPAAPRPSEEPREVGEQFAATLRAAMAPTYVVDAFFTLHCSGRLHIEADGVVLRLNDEQVGRLRRLLGGA